MYFFNKNLPQSSGEDYNRHDSFSDVTNYAFTFVFLAVIFFAFQSFPFKTLQNNISQTLSSIKRGSEIVMGDVLMAEFSFIGSEVNSASKIIKGDMSRIFLEGQGDIKKDLGNRFSFPAIKNINLGIGEVTHEFLLGVRQGVESSFSNFLFVGDIVKSLVIRSFDSVSQSIFTTLDSANKKIALSGREVARISSAVVISQKLDTIATSSFTTGTESVSTSSFNLLTWSSWIIRPGFIPVVFTVYEQIVAPLREILNVVILAVTNTGSSITDGVSIAWGNFFGQLFGGSKSNDLSDVTLREQLKQEILKELQSSSNISVQDGTASTMYTDTGITIMKSSGSSTIDFNNAKKLQDSFSDRVLVNFDSKGETGVIQPIFRDHLGEKYIFVITPIKK